MKVIAWQIDLNGIELKIIFKYLNPIGIRKKSEIVIIDIWMVNINETLKRSDPTGGDQKSGPREFTLGFGSKVWENEVVPMWHHFPAKYLWSSFKKILLFLGYNLESKNKVYQRVLLTSKFVVCWTPKHYSKPTPSVSTTSTLQQLDLLKSS